jgi:hypothetical protein
MSGFEVLVPVLYLGEAENEDGFVMTILFRDACPFSHFIVQFLKGGALKANLEVVRPGWRTENVTITSSAFPEEYLPTVLQVWPSASVIYEPVSMYSEGPLARGFLSTRLAPTSSGNEQAATLSETSPAANNATLDIDLPVMMIFGWSEPDELDFDEAVKILGFFKNILNLEELLGTVVT